MKELHLKCMVRIKKYRSYKGEIGKIAPNLIQRNFKAEKPNQKWTTDITEFALFGTKIYLSPILDIYNGEIISYNISKRPLLGQVMDLLNKAFAKIPSNTNLIFHSVQGWQYQHKLYHLRDFESIENFWVELEKYIEYYNNNRIKSNLKGLSPVQYRIQSLFVA